MYSMFYAIPYTVNIVSETGVESVKYIRCLQLCLQSCTLYLLCNMVLIE